MAGADGAGIHECTESSSTLARFEALHAAPLDRAQLEDCLGLDQRCFGGLWSRQQWGRELADPQRPGLGLWQDGRLVAMACAWLIVDELHITLVAVDPTRRRLGLAQGLLRALLQVGLQLGAAKATLEVGSRNRAALALYRALGFQTTGVRRAYYSDGEDALIQWLDINGNS
jgi:ribosomal-protein-alanine N-acetyltransferase